MNDDPGLKLAYVLAGQIWPLRLLNGKTVQKVQFAAGLFGMLFHSI